MARVLVYVILLIVPIFSFATIYAAISALRNSGIAKSVSGTIPFIVIFSFIAYYAGSIVFSGKGDITIWFIAYYISALICAAGGFWVFFGHGNTKIGWGSFIILIIGNILIYLPYILYQLKLYGLYK